MSTTPPCSTRSWPTFRRFGRRLGGGAPDLPRSTPTKAMTAESTGRICAGVGSPHGSPGVGWSRRPGLGATVEGRAVAVVAELLQAVVGALGPGCGAVVRVRAGGLFGGVLQPALTGQR